MKSKDKIGIFDIVNLVLMLFLMAVCVYPLLYELAVALSDGNRVAAGEVFLFPRGINLLSFEYAVFSPRLGVLRGFANSLFYMLTGTAFAVTVTFMTAYVLTRKRFRARAFIVRWFLATYIFEAGLIPTFIIRSAIGLYNNPLVMILPGCISTFLLLVLRTFLLQVPDAMEESARIDGANDLAIMWRIYWPVSIPSVATLALFYAVQIWNDFLTPVIYLQREELRPLSQVLYSFTVQVTSTESPLSNVQVNGVLLSSTTITAAIVIVTIVPILLVYPFAQRYFTSGLLLGAVKE